MSSASEPKLGLRPIDITWRRVGIVAGFIACVVYPLAVFVPMPTRRMTVVLASSFGPALAIASLGLWHVLRERRVSAAADVAIMANALAGALVTAMILVQLAIQYTNVPPMQADLTAFVRQRLWDIDLGLDVAFDVFIGLGTLLFGWVMLKDPRYGRVVGGLGVIVGGVIILGFNFWTFPTPPRDAGLFDPGPVSGLWYLLVVLMTLRLVLRERAAARRT
jgi:hypothetical protein